MWLQQIKLLDKILFNYFTELLTGPKIYVMFSKTIIIDWKSFTRDFNKGVFITPDP